MASTVVGLFEQRSDAEAALEDLVGNDFSRSDIDLKGAHGGAGAGFDGLLRELEDEGVPADDARLYAEGVRAGDALEIAHTSDDRAALARDIMNRHGALDIHDAYAQRGASAGGGVLPALGAGAAGLAAATALGSGADRTDVGDGAVIPVVAEELAVGKRQIQRGGVRVFQRTEDRPAEEQVTLHEEHVTVQRRAVDRPVTAADGGFAEDTFEVTETREVPVVAKEAHVVEEVVVGKTATERTETVHDTVRHTEVEVEKLPGTAQSRD